MKKINLLLFIVIAFFVSSCNSGAEKIGINNLEMHRAYQDSLILKYKLPEEKFNAIKLLISEYKKMGNDESNNNSNYNYYLARLYSYMYSIPIYGNFYDTLNNKLLNNDLYNNYVDSAYYFSEKSLAIDSNNLMSMLVYTRSLFWERENYLFFKSKGLNARFTADVDFSLWNKRVIFLLNNFTKFSSIDKSNEKTISRKIHEMAFVFLYETVSRKINEGMNWNDENDVKMLLYAGKCISFLKPFKVIEIDQAYYNKASDLLNPYIVKAQMALKKIDLSNSFQANYITKNFLNKKLIIMYGPEDRYVIFKDDGTVEISIQTCDEGGVFGGGTNVNNQIFYGTYDLEGNQYVNVILPAEIYYECNNGYKERWSQNLKFIFNDLRDDHLGVSLYSGVKGYQLPINKKWREWVDLNLAYYLNPYF
jgi:hypothetical protein